MEKGDVLPADEGDTVVKEEAQEEGLAGRK